MKTMVNFLGVVLVVLMAVYSGICWGKTISMTDEMKMESCAERLGFDLDDITIKNIHHEDGNLVATVWTNPIHSERIWQVDDNLGWWAWYMLEPIM